MFFSIIMCLPLLSFSVQAFEDEFKCSLPDVTSNRTDLDLGRFRSDFTKVSEVKFPGLIGPLNERLVCKIKCIDGNWVGPLCSTSKDGRFQPLFRGCVYNGENPLLLLSFKNTTVQNRTLITHGSVLAVRCKEFGVYKMKGESMTRCHNGEWLPRLPNCVPTMLLTNFTGDAPPSITYQLTSGSAWIDPTGELWVYPETTLYLECVSIHTEQNPVWSWTQVLAHYPAELSPLPENSINFRLNLGKVSARHSDQYTCSTSNGETNTISIKVVSVVCPKLEVNDDNVIQSDEGIRLGQSIHLSCKPGFHLNGSSILTCTGSGRWSDLPPTCIETFCPMLKWLSPHLSLVEYNSSTGGKAVFQCAWGYALVGMAAIECGLEGKWSGQPPACIAVYCPRPVVPEHGHIAGETEERHAVGDLVVYGCSESRHLVGEASVVCTESGFWSHPPPFCLETNEVITAGNDTDWVVMSLDTIFVDNTTLVQFQS